MDARAGVVDEHVDLPERLDPGVDERLRVLALGDVAEVHDRAPPEGLDLPLDPLGPLGVPAPDDDVGAGLGECMRECLPEALRRAGDERDAPGEVEEIEDGHGCLP